ncbi:MAG: hypothetical protein HOM68_27015 [Gemmatimonadetes bacterium]|nr:hypothetical protein [Gemmatimonadota bacterium]MBT5060223.1 hypothetical protein [Gemmatimonadota bacterium]MBT5146431.1 hypothetical protein [Gemmatimonadota bacterium]MBT5591353.1 hypothetical protein [Gemmatimonadota bacterium]MBT5962192.1 hypothetical protein [Gemmatimonadota bacterium]
MKRFRISIAAGSIVAGLLLIGCAAEPLVAPAPGVVASIGEERILAQDLRNYAERVPITLLASAHGDSARRQYLRSLLVRRLLAHEAAERGFDTTLAIAQQVDDRLRDKLKNVYLREQVWPHISVEKAKAQAVYDSLGLGLQRRLAGIVTTSSAQAEMLRDALASGERFEALAMKHSIHTSSAPGGGELGYVSQRQAAQLGISASVFANLPDSAISEVIPLGQEFQILRFLHTKIAPIEDFVEQILAVLMEQERQRIEYETLQSLSVEFDWRAVPEGLGILDERGAGDTVLQLWLLEPGEAALPLFTYADTAISIGEFLQISKRNRREIKDGVSAVRVADEILRAEHLYAEAARRLGAHEQPEIVSWQQELVEELAITQLRRQVLDEEPAVTSEDVQKFYKDYPDAFRESADILIVETLVGSEQEALAVLDEVAAGHDLLDIAKRTTLRRVGPSDSRGTLRLNEHERMTNSVLYAAVQQAPLNEVVGPVAVEGGQSVFRVIHREKGALMPFLQVEARAKAYARRFQQNSAFERFVEELLVRHKSQTLIYEIELVQALPDSLIDEIARRDHQRAGLPVDFN